MSVECIVVEADLPLLADSVARGAGLSRGRGESGDAEGEGGDGECPGEAALGGDAHECGPFWDLCSNASLPSSAGARRLQAKEEAVTASMVRLPT